MSWRKLFSRKESKESKIEITEEMLEELKSLERYYETDTRGLLNRGLSLLIDVRQYQLKGYKVFLVKRDDEGREERIEYDIS